MMTKEDGTMITTAGPGKSKHLPEGTCCTSKAKAIYFTSTW